MAIGTPVIPTNGTGSSLTSATSYTTGVMDFTPGYAKVLVVISKNATAVSPPTGVGGATALGNVTSSNTFYNFSWWSLPTSQADGALTISYSAAPSSIAWSLTEVPNVNTTTPLPQVGTPATSASSGTKTATLTQTGANSGILMCYCLNNTSETYTLTGDLALVNDTPFTNVGRAVWAVDLDGGTTESITAASTAIKGYVSFEVAAPAGAPGNYGDTLTFSLNRLAKTKGVPPQGAANIWAGTTNLAFVAALNAKAGNALTAQKPLAAVCNQLAGTTNLTPTDAMWRVIG